MTFAVIAPDALANAENVFDVASNAGVGLCGLALIVAVGLTLLWWMK